MVTFTPRAFALENRSQYSGNEKIQKTFVPLEDDDAVPAADVVRNLGSEALVVHQEDIDIPGVGDEELFQAVG